MTTKKQDNAALDVTTNRDFYPEDAQERNLEEARRLSVENHEHDIDPDYSGASLIDDKATTEIPAQPEVTATKNPEQVKNVEDGDSSVKGEVVEDVQEANFDGARKDAVEATKAE